VTTALLPGSYDPFHLGHLAVVEWAAGTYDEVVVAVMGNPEKAAGLFTPDERVRLIGVATAHLGNVRSLGFQGLTGALAKQEGADVIIRSDHKEADQERSLAVLNKFMSGGVPTEFAPSFPDTESISATKVRDLVVAGDLAGAAQLVPVAIGDELATAERIEGGLAALRQATPAGTGALSMGRRVDPVRVVAIQDAPVYLDRDATLDKALGLIEKAAADGAQVVVFPEVFVPGYPDWVWRTKPWDEHATELYGRLFDNSVVIGSATTQVLGMAAQQHKVYVSIGVNERESAGSTLYNTQLLFGPDSRIVSTHRKLMPTGGERLVWGVGDGSGLSTVDTPFGRIGTLTCWENYMPLARAALYAQGVDIYLAPTWDNSPVWPATMQHIAKEGRCFVIGVNHCIRASDLPADLPGRDVLYPDRDDWLARGNTMVVDHDGAVVGGPLTESSGTVVVDIDVNEARHARQRFDVAGHYNRPDLFTFELDMKRRQTMKADRDKPPERDAAQFAAAMRAMGMSFPGLPGAPAPNDATEPDGSPEQADPSKS
jgi:nitrilase